MAFARRCVVGIMLIAAGPGAPVFFFFAGPKVFVAENRAPAVIGIDVNGGIGLFSMPNFSWEQFTRRQGKLVGAGTPFENRRLCRG